MPEKSTLNSSARPVKDAARLEQEIQTSNELRSLFEWGPSMAVAGPGASVSPSTHPPNDYAMHLNPNQRLRSIVHVPSLAQSFVRVALQAAKNVKDLPESSLRTGDLKGILDSLTSLSDKPLKMLNETSVEGAYKAIAVKLLPIAVTLKYKTDSWSSEGFRWDLDHTRQQLAMGDGFLRMENRNTTGTDDLKAMYDYFRELAIWEFKAMQVVSDDVMRAIHDLAHHQQTFPWISCSKKTCGKNIHQSTLNPGRPKITGSREGLDVDDGIAFDVRRCACTCDHKKLPKVQTKAARDNATRIVEQLWSQAVYLDTTFVVLHSAAKEIIGIRCRETQTLYISSTIYPSSARIYPSGSKKPLRYGAIQIGLLLSIISDAEARTKKIQACGASLPTSWTLSYDMAINPQGSESDLSFQRQSTIVDIKPLDPDEVLQRTLRSISLTVSFPKSIALPAAIGANDILHRRLPAGNDFNSALPLVWAVQQDSDAHIILSLRQNVEQINGETVRFPSIEILGTKISGIEREAGFVAKFSCSTYGIQKLHHEFICYTYLRARGVTCIPSVVGYFETRLSLTRQYPSVALVLENAGEAAQLASGGLYEYHIKRILDGLRTVHAAGIMHGPIFASDIRKDGDGKFTIVGWTESRLRDSSKPEDDEKAELDALEILLKGGNTQPQKQPRLAASLQTPDTSEATESVHFASSHAVVESSATLKEVAAVIAKWPAQSRHGVKRSAENALTE